MPLPTSNSKHSATNKKSDLKKWLPSIVFAVAVNFIFIALFLNGGLGDKQTEKDAKDTASNAAQIDTVMVDGQPDKLMTLTEKAIKEEDKEGSENIEDTINTNEEKNDESTAHLEKPASEADAKKNQQQANATIDISTENTALQTQPAINNARQPAHFIENTSTQQEYTNPNDQLLLPMDIPAVERKASTGDKEFDEMANKTQKINEQLSQAIQQVKEQKLREIDTDLERIKANPSANP